VRSLRRQPYAPRLQPYAPRLQPCAPRPQPYVSRCAACDGSDDVDDLGLGPIIDGAGYVVLASARRRRGLQHTDRFERSAEAAALPPPPPLARRRAAAAAHRRVLAEEEGTCCGSVVGSDAFYGDTNGDCVFDIKDVRRRASAPLLSPAASLQPCVPSLQP
jgi:hypothetical protein